MVSGSARLNNSKSSSKDSNSFKIIKIDTTIVCKYVHLKVYLYSMV